MNPKSFVPKADTLTWALTGLACEFVSRHWGFRFEFMGLGFSFGRFHVCVLFFKIETGEVTSCRLL